MTLNETLQIYYAVITTFVFILLIILGIAAHNTNTDDCLEAGGWYTTRGDCYVEDEVGYLRKFTGDKN